MKKMQSILATVTILLLAALYVAGCGSGNGSQNKNSNENDPVAAIPVEVGSVEIGDVSAFFTSTTTLEAEGDAKVVAKVSGILKKIYVEEGDYVQAGDVLAKLDDEIYRIQLAQEEATTRRLEAEYERKKILFANEAVSTQEYQRAKFDHESQKAALELAQLNLDNTAILAPISGVVSERMIKVGNMILENSETFRITNFNSLLAVLHVPERELEKLRERQQVTLTVDALGDLEFAGYVDRISPVVNPETGTVKVTVEVHDTTGQLRAGMFARINIVYDTHKNTLLVPKEAVLKEDTESSLFVVVDSLAFRRVVETGYANTAHVEILAGISKDDIVVTAGQGSLKDSAVVEVIRP